MLVTCQGDILISIEVVTSEEAASRPAGKGRSDPNQNPTLPPPTGRFKLVS